MKCSRKALPIPKNSCHKLILRALLVLSSVLIFLPSCSSSEESNNSAVVSAVDNTTTADNSSTSGSTTTADTTAPSSPTISINSGASSTTSASVTLTLSASDDTGVTAYFLSESSTAPTASFSWISVSSTQSYSSSNIAFTLSSGSGTKTVTVWFQDATGNISSSASDSLFLIDNSGVLASADSEGMVRLSGGSFTMGDIQTSNLTGATPTHSVTLSSFYISEDEVTASEYAACVSAGTCTAQDNTSSSYGDTTGKPVDVSWNDAQDYLIWKKSNSSRNFRLCTEAEWEYAARAGTDTQWACGNTESCLTVTTPPMAWFYLNSGTAVHVIKTTTPNAWGLYDMHGNLFEWVNDWYDANYYTIVSSGVTDPTGPTTGLNRVFRGGFFMNPGEALRSASRSYDAPMARNGATSFRLCSSH